MHFTLITSAILLAASAVSALVPVPREEPRSSSLPSDLDINSDVIDDYTSLLASNILSALALHQQQANEASNDPSSLSARDLGLDLEPEDEDALHEALLELLLDDDAITALAARSLPDTSPALGLIARDPGIIDDIKKKVKGAGKAIKNFIKDTKALIKDAADGRIGKCHINNCGKALGPATISCIRATAARGTNIMADLACLQKALKARKTVPKACGGCPAAIKKHY